MEPAKEKPLTLAQLAELVARHEREAAKHTNLAKLYTQQIRTQLGHPAKEVPAGNMLVTWQGPRKSFDAPSFIVAYPPETNAHMYKQVPNSDAIPKNLKDRFMVEGKGDGTVTIK